MSEEADQAAKYRWLIEHFPAQITLLAWGVPDARKDEHNPLDATDRERAEAAMSVAVKQVPGKR